MVYHVKYNFIFLNKDIFLICFVSHVYVISFEIYQTSKYALHQKLLQLQLSVGEKELGYFSMLIYTDITDKLNKLHARVTLTKSLQINQSYLIRSKASQR